ncbi:hypothetical protein Hte_006461 [Hypoxylon texense]
MEHEVLPDVIVDTVRQFHAILTDIRECLPPDPSPSFPQKFHFVFKKNDILVATKRLEECKTNASLALNIINSRSSIKFRENLNTLKIVSEEITVQRRTAAQDLSRQASRVLAATQDISQQQTQVFETLEQVDRRTLEMASQLRLIQSATIAENFYSKSARFTKAIVAADEETLVKLVRFYVKETVQAIAPDPDIERETASKIDDFSSHIALQAHDTVISDMKEIEKSRVAALTGESAAATETDAGAIVPNQPRSKSLTPNEGHAWRSDAVQLSRRFKYIRLRWATIMVRITRLRRRQADIHYTDSYFSAGIDIIPRRLTAVGVSLFCTDASDDAGYYSICPRILTFGVISCDAPVWDVIKRDDVDALRRMIVNREVGARDRTGSGRTLLRMALRSRALACCRFMLNGTGISRPAVLDFSNIRNMQQLISRAFSPFTSETVVESHHVQEIHQIYLLGLECGLEPEARVNKWPPRVGFERKAGHVLMPFTWPMKSSSYDQFWLEASLKTGGDPDASMPHESGQVPLECAIERLALMRGESEITSRLLVLLIGSGADLFYAREINGCLRSVTDLAIERGLKDFWEEALKECGYDPTEVYREDVRHRLAHGRLYSAERSGVDVEPIVEVHSTDGLRQRHRAPCRTEEESTID